MNASVLKRTLVITAVVAVPWIGWSLWTARREAAEREALAAEIRAEMEARQREPADAAAGLADLTEPYRTALGAAGDVTVSQAVHGRLFRTAKWREVPPEVAALLRARGPSLDAFAVAVEGLPRGRMALSQGDWIRLSGIVTLLQARGKAQVTTGDLSGLLGTVRLLRRLAAAVSASTGVDTTMWPANLSMGIERAALDLLARLAVHPALEEKEAIEGLAVAGGPWAVAGTPVRTSHWVLEEHDRICLDLLSIDAKERMKERYQIDDDSPLELVGGFLKGRTPKERAGPRDPPRAEVLRRMRDIAARQRAAFERRDAAAVRLESASALELYEDLGGGWTTAHVSHYPLLGRERWDTEVRVSVLRAAFAIRLHEIRHGCTPASLEDLVPSLLEAVPVDPWTGEKVRFTIRPNGWALEAGHPDTTVTHPGGWTEMRVPYYLEK